MIPLSRKIFARHACCLALAGSAIVFTTSCANLTRNQVKNDPTRWMRIDHFSDTIATQKSKGNYPVNPTGALDQGARLYRSDFASHQDNSIRYFTVYGVLGDQFNKSNRELASGAYRLTSHQTFRDENGRTRHQATWTKQS
jgi:hypothetical protein